MTELKSRFSNDSLAERFRLGVSLKNASSKWFLPSPPSSPKHDTFSKYSSSSNRVSAEPPVASEIKNKSSSNYVNLNASQSSMTTQKSNPIKKSLPNIFSSSERKTKMRLDRGRKSLSTPQSPSPLSTEGSKTTPPRPRRHKASPSASAGFCIPRAELPPRSDSRTGHAPTSSISSTGSSIPPNTRRPKFPPPVGRPISPSFTTQSLHASNEACTETLLTPVLSKPQRQPIVTIAPFKVDVVQKASRGIGLGKIWVKINIGGTRFETSGETLTARDSYLSTLIKEEAGEREKEVESDSLNKEAHDEEEKDADPECDGQTLTIPLCIPLSTRSQVSTADYARTPPNPSPFEYSYNLYESDEHSPFDSIKPMFSSGPEFTFLQKGQVDLPIDECTDEYQGEFVPSPLPHDRITSVHPAICSINLMDDSVEFGTWPSGSIKRLSDSEKNGLQKLDDAYNLLPQHTLFEEVKVSKSTIVQATSPQHESSGIPIDVDVLMDQDSSRSTLLGVPRGETPSLARRRRNRKRIIDPNYDYSASLLGLPETPMDTATLTAFALPPSPEAALPESTTIEIQIDRDPAMFGPILSWLRTGQLPASVSIPSGYNNEVDEVAIMVYTMQPEAALGLLGRINELAAEARWYGLNDLVTDCEREKTKVGNVLRSIEEEKARRRYMKQSEIANAALAKAGFI